MKRLYHKKSAKANSTKPKPQDMGTALENAKPGESTH